MKNHTCLELRQITRVYSFLFIGFRKEFGYGSHIFAFFLKVRRQNNTCAKQCWTAGRHAERPAGIDSMGHNMWHKTAVMGAKVWGEVSWQLSIPIISRFSSSLGNNPTHQDKPHAIAVKSVDLALGGPTEGYRQLLTSNNNTWKWWDMLENTRQN